MAPKLKRDSIQRDTSLLRNKTSEETVNSYRPWQTEPTPFPVKVVLQAAALLLFGCGWLITGAYGYLTPTPSQIMLDMRLWSVIIGALLFIPGFYHCRLAYYAWKRVPGYDFSQLAD